MALDGIFLQHLVAELQPLLVGGKISKIHQPSQSEILLTIRSQRQNHKLLFSTHPNFARCNLTQQVFYQPDEPPMFCMLLRRYLDGGIITAIEQLNLDRVIRFTIRHHNDLGDVAYKTLVLETMGRHSNLILLDEQEQIIDSLKRVSPSQNRYRTILPKQPYIAPPFDSRYDYRDLPADLFATQHDEAFIAQNLQGCSRRFARYLSERLATLSQAEVFAQLTTTPPMPTLVRGNQEDFYWLDIFAGVGKTVASLNVLLDEFFHDKDERDRIKQQTQNLAHFVNQELDRNRRKLIKLEATITESENAAQFQQMGDLLFANSWLVKPHASEVSLINYFDESQPEIIIPLDPRLNVKQNAQKYFQKYTKAKTALIIVQEQISLTENEITYFETLAQHLSQATTQDAQEIRFELEQNGYVRARAKKHRRHMPKPTFERYLSATGTEIWVGKNNLQNEHLTFKSARRNHIWMHAKDMPGSHVVLCTDQPDEATIRAGAMLAAYYSKGRESSSVPIDYLPIRQLKKPNGAKPGFVTYEQQKTIYIDPDVDLLPEQLF
ncbi:MAG: Rqc2 family fibronectin-binding protein [Culicoidibacterales bacterium]